MKNIAIIIFVVLVVVVLGLYLVSFQVRETESALVMTLGKPTRGITEPGWYFKWPPPIQSVYKFDSRMRVYEADLGETTTKGITPIIVNTYVVWKIADPLQFFNSVGTVEEAESKLGGRINDTQGRVIGQYSFGEFVNSDPSKIKFDQIQGDMESKIRRGVRDDYGIEIMTLGIKQLKVSEDVSEDVFKRMSAGRLQKAAGIISEGEAEATRIRSDANKKKEVLLAAAEGRAKAIMGQGDAEAAQYYRMLEAEPELAMLLRSLEAFVRIADANATIVIPADTEPF
ncbi:MAG: protease modulator HflC, partial [Planctomycetota bacterium]